MRKTYQEMRKSDVRKIAVAYPVSVPWMARCMDGLRAYARAHGNWHIFSSPPTLRGAEETALTLRTLRDWKGDAVLVVSSDVRELRMAARMRIPVVNLSGGLAQSYGVPRVMVNHYSAGRLAAEHLLERGLRNLAFFGWKDLWYSEQRCKGFKERAAEAGIECEMFLQKPGEEVGQTWTRLIAKPGKWLASLPRPAGVFAVQDYRAQFLIEACQEAELRVPEDIAVIGMDNDVTLCEHSIPTLSSVSRNAERVGWIAAELIDRLMNGDAFPSAEVLIEPDGVIPRQSTDRLYCSDPLVQAAVDLTREHLKKPWNIATLAGHVGVSKRTLEMRFRENLGCSPHDFLTKLRILQAQTLLQTQKQWPLEQIAAECGFGTCTTFYAAFRRQTGQTPASFRRQCSSGTD